MSWNQKICDKCMGYMVKHLNLDGWLTCNCGFAKKELKSMVTIQELLGKIKFVDISAELQSNIKDLYEKINKVRTAFGKPMVVTSGYRSKDHHIAVYKSLAKQRGQQFDEKKIPWGSKHLTCQAVDISDPDGSLFKWVKDNETLMVEIGLFMEEADDQKRVHFQTKPYGSWSPGKSQFFKP